MHTPETGSEEMETRILQDKSANNVENDLEYFVFNVQRRGYHSVLLDWRNVFHFPCAEKSLKWMRLRNACHVNIFSFMRVREFDAV